MDEYSIAMGNRRYKIIIGRRRYCRLCFCQQARMINQQNNCSQYFIIITIFHINTHSSWNYQSQMLVNKIIRQFSQNVSVSQRQMQLFNKLTGWWHPSGPSQILYVYNYHRIQFLRKFKEATDPKYPLKGDKILDVGCGAGFLSESLARLGGNVIGLDPNQTSYNEASTHKSTKSDLSKLKYFNISLQQFIETKPQEAPHKFDIVTSMEVIEHVNDPQEFLNSISSVTKDGGLIMLSTIRRTPYSWLTHIALAEKVLGIVPNGTHHHEQFINPDQCSRMLETSGCETLDVLELELNWKGEFQKKKGGSNYLIMGRKKVVQTINKQRVE